jgi:hypothetical protein
MKIRSPRLNTLTAGHKAVSAFLATMQIEGEANFAALKAAALLTKKNFGNKLEILETACKNNWSRAHDVARRDDCIAKGKTEAAGKFDRRIKGAANALKVVRQAISQEIELEKADIAKMHRYKTSSKSTKLVQRPQLPSPPLTLGRLETLFSRKLEKLGEKIEDPYEIVTQTARWLADVIEIDARIHGRARTSELLRWVVEKVGSEPAFLDMHGGNPDRAFKGVDRLIGTHERTSTAPSAPLQNTLLADGLTRFIPLFTLSNRENVAEA